MNFPKTGKIYKTITTILGKHTYVALDSNICVNPQSGCAKKHNCSQIKGKGLEISLNQLEEFLEISSEHCFGSSKMYVEVKECKRKNIKRNVTTVMKKMLQ